MNGSRRGTLLMPDDKLQKGANRCWNRSRYHRSDAKESRSVTSANALTRRDGQALVTANWGR